MADMVDLGPGKVIVKFDNQSELLYILISF